jgi:hypothetical protein
MIEHVAQMTKRSGTGAAKCAARRFLAPEPLAKQAPTGRNGRAGKRFVRLGSNS